MTHLEGFKLVFFIRTLEEVDCSQQVFSSEKAQAIRERIQKEENSASNLPQDWTTQATWLQRRAQWIWKDCQKQWGAHKLSLPPVANHTIFLYGLWVIAFGLGVGSNLLGQETVVNILTLPLWIVLLWNFCIYFFLLARSRSSFSSNPNQAAHQWMQFLWKRFFLVEEVREDSQMLSKSPSVVFAKAQSTFQRQWFQMTWPYQECRIRQALHIAAMLTALGMVSGMYCRGLLQEYRIGWESTFLAAKQVLFFLQLMLQAAVWISGIELPTVEAFQQLKIPETAGKNAALWIHLFAITVILFIVVPRCFLYYLTHKRLQSIQQIDWLQKELLPYFEQVFLAPRSTDKYSSFASISKKSEVYLRVICYGLPLPAIEETQLYQLFRQFFDSTLQIEPIQQIFYGEEAQMQAELADYQGNIVLLMDFNATPETDAHGEVVQQLKQSIQQANGTLSLFWLLNTSRFHKISVLPEFEQRYQARQFQWTQLAEKYEIPFFTLSRFE